MGHSGNKSSRLVATGSPIGLLYNFGRPRLENNRLLTPQNVQDWQKHLYRVIHKAPGMKLPPLPSSDSSLSGRK